MSVGTGTHKVFSLSVSVQRVLRRTAEPTVKKDASKHALTYIHHRWLSAAHGTVDKAHPSQAHLSLHTPEPGLVRLAMFVFIKATRVRKIKM